MAKAKTGPRYRVKNSLFDFGWKWYVTRSGLDAAVARAWSRSSAERICRALNAQVTQRPGR